MPICELCGRKASRTVKIEIEGALIDVCSECASKAKARVLREIKKNYTTAKSKPSTSSNIRRDDISVELESRVLRQDYGRVIKEAREKQGLRIEDLARIIGEKSSVIQRIEAGKLKPDSDLARRLEKVLKISLFEATPPRAYASRLIGESEFNLTVADVLGVSESGVKRKVEGLRTENGSQD
ncbi:MAG: multiprotein bridging factor aMBF1 [Candidatus Bathyarchaeia archaeon]|nr:TIGR00270 family protein [Candidatus Bathyarchaeota archaeon]